MNIYIGKDKNDMAQHAADAAADHIRAAIAARGEARIIVATGASQFEFLAALVKEPGIDWTKVTGFHLDEYAGLPVTHKASFRAYMRERFVSQTPQPMKAFNEVDGEATDPEAECARLKALVRAAPIDLACIGFGENGHIAFNDPWVADFDDPVKVKAVPLDEVCRNQQVHDGCFPTLDDVPKFALTLTIPALTSAAHMFCSVPAATKRDAVRRTVNEDITVDCPATIMRKHPHAVLYCDSDSGADLV